MCGFSIYVTRSKGMLIATVVKTSLFYATVLQLDTRSHKKEKNLHTQELGVRPGYIQACCTHAGPAHAALR